GWLFRRHDHSPHRTIASRFRSRATEVGRVAPSPCLGSRHRGDDRSHERRFILGREASEQYAREIESPTPSSKKTNAETKGIEDASSKRLETVVIVVLFVSSSLSSFITSASSGQQAGKRNANSHA